MKTQPITRQVVAVEGRALRQALASLLRVIERRNTYPILSTVLLSVDGPTLTLRGTDLDIGMTISLDTNEASGSWQMCVAPKVLAGIARVAGVGLVRIERVQRLNADLTVTLEYDCRVTLGDDATYTLQTFDASAWPTMAGERGPLIERFTNGMLGQMLDKVAPYISTEETRYYLNGVCWQSGDRGYRFAATDGHRLGLCVYNQDKGGAAASRIIPRKTVALLRAITAGQDVSIYAFNRGKDGAPAVYDTGLELTFGRTTVRTKLIEGTFPDVDRVIPAPATNPVKLVMPRDEILSALDRAMVMQERFSTASQWFERDGKLAVRVRSVDQGVAEAVTNIDYPAGSPEFGLNAQYIRGMIASCQGQVTMHVKDDRSPFLVTDEDETMTRVLMPMRV